METTIIDAALSQGIWAVLAIFLLIYVMKENEKRDQRQADREEKYQELLSELTEKFQVLVDVKKELDEISEVLFLDTPENNNSA